MASVVCEPCKGYRCTKCVVVCPVDAFHEDADMLVINPETCIDCGACQPECPVNAIFDEVDVPEQWIDYIALNAEKSRKLPVINERKEPLR